MFILDERECIKVLLEIYWVLKEGGLFIFIMYDREQDENFFVFWWEEKECWEKGE